MSVKSRTTAAQTIPSQATAEPPVQKAAVVPDGAAQKPSAREPNGSDIRAYKKTLGLSTPGKFATPQQTLETFLAATEKGDVPTYLQCLTKNMRASLLAIAPQGALKYLLADQRDEYATLNPALGKLVFQSATKQSFERIQFGGPPGGPPADFVFEDGGWRLGN
ncbi:MAG: hypothetical protein IT381_18645 [Deltaproteobacteria bacterium]|nr:hypothetical protein [Deltaproteobacteria bacterium]